MAKEDWDSIWEGEEIDISTDEARLAAEERTLRWREMAGTIDESLGGTAGLRAIEVGAGLGDFSLLLNRHGAQTTLADYSEPAIEKGRAWFYAHGLSASFVLADMLDPPAELV